MTRKSTNLENQARALSATERARLALKLIESLDPGEDQDADELWLDEAERRLREYDAGETRARTVSDVVAEIERKLR